MRKLHFAIPALVISLSLGGAAFAATPSPSSTPAPASPSSTGKAPMQKKHVTKKPAQQHAKVTAPDAKANAPASGK